MSLPDTPLHDNFSQSPTHTTPLLGRWALWAHHLLCVLLTLLLVTPIVSMPTMAQQQQDFLPPDEAFAIATSLPSPDRLMIEFHIAPNYYMYRDHVRFEVVGDDAEQTFKRHLMGEPQFPDAIIKYDLTFGLEMPVYYEVMPIEVPLYETGQAVRLHVTAQGCADAGLCYPPEVYPINLEPVPGGYQLQAETGLFQRLLGGTGGANSEAPPLDFSRLEGLTSSAASTDLATEVATANDATSEQRTSANESLAHGSDSSAQRVDDLAESIEAQNLRQASDTELASRLRQAGIWQVLLISFGLGLLLSLTPCVLPMLPILLALVVGQRQSTGEGEGEGEDDPIGPIQGLDLNLLGQDKSEKAEKADAAASVHISRVDATTKAKDKAKPQHPLRSLGLTLVYVFGTSIVYTLLGVIAASLGAALSVWIQNPWVLSIFAIVLVLLAFAMFGSFTMQTPTGIQSRLHRLMDRLPGGHYGSALIMGMLAALIAGPCVAAPLAGVLLFISQTGDMLTGGLALFALAWGQGASLIVIGATSGALMPKTGPWMEAIKQFAGLLLLATALWMVQSLLPVWLTVLLWVVLGLSFAQLCGAFNHRNHSSDQQPSTATTSVWRFFIKATGYMALVWSVLLLVGLASGKPSLLRPLQGFSMGTGGTTVAAPAVVFERIESLDELQQRVTEAATQSRPVMLDFYADWCIACHEMEAFTFSDPQVAQQMQQFLLLQVDVTSNTPAHRELLRRFNLFGPPGIIFFDRQGQEVHSVRVVGFQNAQRFGEHLAQVLGR